MPVRTVVTHSEPETEALGAELARALRPGDLVALAGDLGSGKTCFARGICRGLGVSGHITSPTFTIVNEYRSGRLPVFHFDFYRVGSVKEISDLGFEEYLTDGGVCLVEWPDRAEGLLPDERLDISFSEGKQAGERIIVINSMKPVAR